MNKDNEHDKEYPCSDEQANDVESFRVEIDSDSNMPTTGGNRPDADSTSTNRPQSDDHAEYKLIKKTQNFALSGSICGCISVIIGGVLLSSIGLGLGIAALMKYKKLCRESFDPSLYKRLKISSIAAIAISAGALLINFISAIVLFPTILAMLQGEDTSSISSILDSYTTQPTYRSNTWG